MTQTDEALRWGRQEQVQRVRLERISGNYMNGLMAVMRGATDGKSAAELAAIARASLWQEGQW